MTTTEPGAVTEDVPGPDIDPDASEEPGEMEPLHPDAHILHATYLLDLGQVLSAQGDQEDMDMRALCALMAAGAHAQIAAYELMRRAAANDGLISADYRGPDPDEAQSND